MKYLLIALAFTLASCSDSNAVGPEPPPDPEQRFLQLSSLVDQVRSEEEIIPGRIFTENIDAQEGIETGEANAVVITNEGLYGIQLSVQSGKQAGCGRYWIELNGEAIPNSAVEICQSCPTLTSRATSQVTLLLVEEDTITFWQTGKLGIQASIPDDLGEPSVPSASVTVVEL